MPSADLTAREAVRDTVKRDCGEGSCLRPLENNAIQRHSAPFEPCRGAWKQAGSSPPRTIRLTRRAPMVRIGHLMANRYVGGGHLANPGLALPRPNSVHVPNGPPLLEPSTESPGKTSGQACVPALQYRAWDPIPTGGGGQLGPQNEKESCYAENGLDAWSLRSGSLLPGDSMLEPGETGCDLYQGQRARGARTR